MEQADASYENDQRGCQRYQKLNYRHYGGGDAAGLDVRAEVIGVHAVEAPAVFVLARETLDDPDSGDILLEVRVDDSNRLARPDERCAGAHLPHGHDDDQDRDYGKRDQGKLDVQVHQEEDDER